MLKCRVNSTVFYVVIISQVEKSSLVVEHLAKSSKCQVLAYATGHHSGGQLNPAVTFSSLGSFVLLPTAKVYSL